MDFQPPFRYTVPTYKSDIKQEDAEANQMKKTRWKVWIGGALAGAALLACVFFRPAETPATVSYPEFWEKAESGQIDQVTVGDGAFWQLTLPDGTRAQTPNPRAEDAKERLLMLGIDVRERENAAPFWPVGILALGALLLMSRSRGAVGLQKYAAVQADQHVPDVTFSDVAAPAETLQSMRDLVDFLRDASRFSRYGARLPRGVILYGPPGTGKTLLARALAGEAKTPFFAMSGADFVQVYVGVGASRVRELFKKARKAGGGVIFIDEIDAIGKKRDSGNEEREQTLNALLTEMSGFSQGEGILVLAATNRLDTLDPALLREGRFDRHIELGLPDRDQRKRILDVHARKKPLAAHVDLDAWAEQTALFSGAQLEALLNEAAIRAARRGAEQIEPNDMEAAFCAVTVGEDRPRRMTEEEKRILAWHEAGHALITRRMQPDTRITRVSVIPSSRGAAGYAMSVQPDHLVHTRPELTAMICAALGGRAAEEMLLGKENVTTGAENDLKKARDIASAMAGQWAMGDTGDPETDQKAILAAALDQCRRCLRENCAQLERLAQALMEKETLREEDIRSLLP